MKIFLYIKTHNQTGLKYFGKTTRDPFKYRGSGKYWKRHIKKHGNDVTTEVIATFDNEEDACTFAIEFSHENDIVNSDLWANLVIENGKDGAPVGHKGHVFTEEQLKKMSESSKNKWNTEGFREKMSELQKLTFSNGRVQVKPNWTDARKQSHSELMKGYSKTHPNVNFLKYVLGERSDKHKDSLSKALKDKPKNKDHKDNLSWSKLTKGNDYLLNNFKNYKDFVLFCQYLKSKDMRAVDISNITGASLTAVYRALRYDF